MSRSNRKRQTEGPPPAIPGTILPDAVYSLDEFLARSRWGGHAYRAARRRGLKVHACGKRRYVLGRDAIAFITKESPDAN